MRQILQSVVMLSLLTSACVSDDSQQVVRPVRVDGGADDPLGVLASDVVTLDFGIVDVGSSATKTVVLTNTTETAIRVATVTSSDETFVVTNNACGVDLGFGAQCSVEVRFTPKALGARVGAVLELRDATNVIKRVPLAGIGRERFTVTVNKNGDGSGTVTSTEATPRINCGPNCEENVDVSDKDVSLTLRATPDVDNVFKGWSDPACPGTGDCTLNIKETKTVTATFETRKEVLRVEYVEDQPGIGALTTNLAGVSCAGVCAKDFPLPAGTSVTFSPPADAAVRFSGDCTAVNGQPCVVSMTQSRTVKLRASKYNYAFVSSLRYDGNLGGLAGADAKCEGLAKTAGLPGTFKAWLSDRDSDAKMRIIKGGHIRTDGSILTHTYADLTVGFLRNPGWLDENKVKHAEDVAGERVWTATRDTGLKYFTATSVEDCAKWSSNAAVLPPALVGITQGQASSWTTANSSVCSMLQRIQCMGVDVGTDVPLPIPQAPFRRAFISSSKYLPTDTLGVAKLDQACKTEAAASGLPNATKYLALVAPNNTTSAASRFTTSATAGPWVRMDGVPIAATAADFMAGALTSGIVLSRSSTLFSVVPVFTGYVPNGGVSKRPDDIGTATCDGWTNPAATFGGGFTTQLGTWTFGESTNPCTTAGYLYCLEN